MNPSHLEPALTPSEARAGAHALRLSAQDHLAHGRHDRALTELTQATTIERRLRIEHGISPIPIEIPPIVYRVATASLPSNKPWDKKRPVRVNDKGQKVMPAQMNLW